MMLRTRSKRTRADTGDVDNETVKAAVKKSPKVEDAIAVLSSNESDSDTENEESNVEESSSGEEDIADVINNITSMFDTATKLNQNKSDHYFLGQITKTKTGKSKESFATLLDKFDMQDDEIQKIVDTEHARFCNNFHIRPFSDTAYAKLYHFLKCDFNIILYGFGSKRDILNSFVDKYLSHHYNLNINGFMDNFKIRDFIELLNQTIEAQNPIYDENLLFAEMKEYYKEDELILVIHSVDLLFTKNPKIKDLLYNLFVTVPNVRIVASVDHVNSSMLWSLSESSIFRWLWMQKDTYKSYFIERKYSSNHSAAFSSSSKSWTQSTNLQGITQVYNQVNRNSQQIFMMILKHHMASKAKSYPFHILYSDCREEFLVNSEVTLRQHLKEFQYHNLVRLAKSANGVESITVTIEKDTCQRFLDSISDD